MAIGDTPITLVGNVVADPELRFTPSGAAVANFRVASTPRVYNRESGQYEDGEALFLTCNVWRQAAENVAESLSKGMRVIVNGRLKQRSYQNREGENRTVYEVEVDEVGPSLKFATAQVNRTPREGGGGNWGGGGGGNTGGGGAWGGGGGNTGGSWGGGANTGGGNTGGGGAWGGGGGNTGGGGAWGGGGGNTGGNNPGPQTPAPSNDPWNSAPLAGGDDLPGEPPF